MPKEKNYKTTNFVDPLVEIEDTNGDLHFFDHDNPDINLVNMIDAELIKIAGSPILYYQFIAGETQYDPVYMEARDKPIASEPITLYGHYDPKVVEENLTQFGIEVTNDQVFTFNKSYIDQTVKGGLKPGDILQPKFQNQKYEIFEVQEDSFELYGVYHLVCSAKLLRDTEQVVDVPLTDKAETLDGPGIIPTLEEGYDDL